MAKAKKGNQRIIWINSGKWGKTKLYLFLVPFGFVYEHVIKKNSLKHTWLLILDSPMSNKDNSNVEEIINS